MHAEPAESNVHRSLDEEKAKRVSMNGFNRIIRRCLHAFAADHGSAAVSFILTFPIFLTIVAVIVQLALMVNARIMVAVLPGRCRPIGDDKPFLTDIRKMSGMPLHPRKLCALGPEATSGSSRRCGGCAVNALRSLGVDVPDSLAARYAYAMEATTVSWSPEIDFAARSKASEVEVTVNYQFHLTVPSGDADGACAQKHRIGGLSVDCSGRFPARAAWKLRMAARRKPTAMVGLIK